MTGAALWKLCEAILHTLCAWSLVGGVLAGIVTIDGSGRVAEAVL
jgi:hypothetical protein